MQLAQRSQNRPFLLSFQMNFPNFSDLLCWPVLFFMMLKSSSVWLHHWASMSFSCWGFSQWKAPGITKRGEMPKYCPFPLDIGVVIDKFLYPQVLTRNAILNSVPVTLFSSLFFFGNGRGSTHCHWSLGASFSLISFLIMSTLTYNHFLQLNIFSISGVTSFLIN